MLRRSPGLIFALLLLAVTTAAGVVVWSGVYNVAANSQHTQVIYSLLEYAMQRSVKLRARNIETPALTAPHLFERGAACYQQHCEQCHGGPGVAQDRFALGTQPLPGSLINASRRWSARELYWITRNGITMSGMPAWGMRLADDDLWALVAFLERLPQLSPSEYRTTMAQPMTGRCKSNGNDQGDDNADASRGRLAMSQYACNGCHKIPGVSGSDVHVGPPLGGIARRQLIAGMMANTPEHMVRWLRNPQSVDPLTAMPNLEVTERDARAMAAYLATLN